MPAKHWKTFVRSCLKGPAGRRTTSRDQPASAAVEEDRDEATGRTATARSEEIGRTSEVIAAVPVRTQTAEEVEIILID